MLIFSLRVGSGREEFRGAGYEKHAFFLPSLLSDYSQVSKILVKIKMKNTEALFER